IEPHGRRMGGWVWHCTRSSPIVLMPLLSTSDAGLKLGKEPRLSTTPKTHSASTGESGLAVMVSLNSPGLCRLTGSQYGHRYPAGASARCGLERAGYAQRLVVTGGCDTACQPQRDVRR